MSVGTVTMVIVRTLVVGRIVVIGLVGRFSGWLREVVRVCHRGSLVTPLGIGLRIR